MIPFLIYKERELKVLGLQYTNEKVSSVIVVGENNEIENFYDVDVMINYDKKIDIKNSLIWRDNENIKKINKRIEALEEIMNDLALDYIRCDDIFASMNDKKKEFDKLSLEVEGLKQALSIINGIPDSKTQALNQLIKENNATK